MSASDASAADDGEAATLRCFFSPAASCGDPPSVPNARLFGRKRLRYETDALVRYYCEDSFVQTLKPVVRCLPGGQWEQPLITCRPSESGVTCV